MLNMPEYALIMCKYALKTLNMTEYVSINWKNQSAEYARILNVSDASQSKRCLYKLLIIYQDRCIQNAVKHLRWSVLRKE